MLLWVNSVNAVISPVEAHDPSGLTGEFCGHPSLMAVAGCLGTITVMLLLLGKSADAAIIPFNAHDPSGLTGGFLGQ